MPLSDDPPSVAASTLLIWGVRDACAERTLADASIALCDNGNVVHLDRATRWVQHDEPERVTQLLVEFLTA